MAMLQQATLSFKVATDEWDRLQARYIIEQTFIDELGYSEIRPDKYNDIAVFITANLDEKIIGACRIIFDSKIGLPIDEYADISFLRSSKRKLVEFSRLGSLKEFRAHHIAFHGIGFVKKVAIDLGATHAVIDSFLHTAPLYRRMGFKQLGEPFYDPTVSRNDNDQKTPNAVIMIADVQEIRTPRGYRRDKNPESLPESLIKDAQ